MRITRKLVWMVGAELVLVLFTTSCGLGAEEFLARATPEVAISWQPPAAIPVKISIDSNGEVSVSGTSEMVTPLGVFEISASVSLPEDEDVIIVVVNDQSTGTSRRYRVAASAGRFFTSITGPSTTLIEGNVVVIDVARNAGSTIQFVDKDSTGLAEGRPAERPRTYTEDIVCAQCECIDLTCESDPNLPDDILACAGALGVSDQALLFLHKYTAAVTRFEKYPTLDVAVAADPYCGAGTSWGQVYVLNGPQPDGILNLDDLLYANTSQWVPDAERRFGVASAPRGLGLGSVELRNDGSMTISADMTIQECGACDFLGGMTVAFDFLPSGEFSGLSVRAMWDAE